MLTVNVFPPLVKLKLSKLGFLPKTCALGSDWVSYQVNAFKSSAFEGEHSPPLICDLGWIVTATVNVQCPAEHLTKRTFAEGT